jgi:hypothetical protein
MKNISKHCTLANNLYPIRQILAIREQGVLIVRGTTCSMEVGEPGASDSEPGCTIVVVLDGVPDRTSIVVLEGEDTTYNRIHSIYPHLPQIRVGDAYNHRMLTTMIVATNLPDLVGEESPAMLVYFVG